MFHGNTKSLIKRFSKSIDTLIDLGHVSSDPADKAKRKYSKFIDNNDFISEAKKFSINSDYVDEFYSRIFKFAIISRSDSNCTSLPYSVSWWNMDFLLMRTYFKLI